MSEVISEHNLVQHLLSAAPTLIEGSSITLLRSSTSNVLLIQYSQDVSLNPMLYLELVPIAHFLQENFGISEIYLHNSRQNTTLHWNSQEIIAMAEVWRI